MQVAHTYSGPQDQEAVQHMRDCNPRGPLMVQIAKLFPKQVGMSFISAAQISDRSGMQFSVS